MVPFSGKIDRESRLAELSRMRVNILGVAVLAVGFGCAPAQSATLVVDAKTVIFAAAGNLNPDPQGVIPTAISIPVGSSRLLSVSAVSGSITPLTGSAVFGADGGDFFHLPYSVWPHAGIAGIRDTDIGFTMPLMGIFTAGVPLESARPPDRDASTDKELSMVATVLNQPFSIGDGKTALGLRQFFEVPDAASHFWFGFADAIPQFGIFNGPPGNYSDNAGSLSVTYSFIPEPSTGLLVLLGIALRHRRARKPDSGHHSPVGHLQ